MTKISHKLRRIGVVAVTLAMTSIGVVVGAPAAQAAPPGCYYPWQNDYYIDDNQNIFARNFWICDDGDLLLPSTIERYVSPEVWTTVGSGTGYSSYYCDGHALNLYRVNGRYEFFNTCG